jgi:hypothetical protein
MGSNMDDDKDLYDLFIKDVENTIFIYKEAVGGFAPNTEKIFNNPDKISSLSNLMKSGEEQKGFKILRDKGQLDKTFESLIIKYKQLFKDDIVTAAQWRLKNAWTMRK